MKKIIPILLLMTCFFPVSIAFSMELIEDEELDRLTGASGVTIQFEGTLQVNLEMNRFGWGDTDGIGTGTSKCFFVLEASGTNPEKTNMTLSTVNPIFYIDIGTTAEQPIIAGSSGKVAVAAYTSYVKIDLPDDITAQITPCQYTDLKLVDDPGAGGGKSFGRITTQNVKIDIEKVPSSIYISAHD